MPPRTLLSSEQRTRLFAIPSESVEMVRHYVLGGEDLALIGVWQSIRRVDRTMVAMAIVDPSGHKSKPRYHRCPLRRGANRPGLVFGGYVRGPCGDSQLYHPRRERFAPFPSEYDIRRRSGRLYYRAQ
jgi:hypothetical protein